MAMAVSRVTPFPAATAAYEFGFPDPANAPIHGTNTASATTPFHWAAESVRNAGADISDTSDHHPRPVSTYAIGASIAAENRPRASASGGYENGSVARIAGSG
jgi:hypothetical protein